MTNTTANSTDTVIIYHKIKQDVNCPDGIAAAWVASRTLILFNPAIIGCIHGEEAPNLSQYNNVYIVDFSFSRQVLTKWKEQGKKIILIDHHITAFKELEDFSLHVKQFDMNECGATLAWKYFFSNKSMPVFLEYVRDRDLWNHQLEYTEEVNAAMSYLQCDFNKFDWLATLTLDQLLGYLVPIGTKQLAPKRKCIADALERIEWGTVAGYNNIPFVQVNKDEETLVSDICAAMYKQFPEALFVACKTDTSWSLRSNKHGNNTNVGAIAKSMGGGGHHCASGFEIKD